jgi:hypothetical protein
VLIFFVADSLFHSQPRRKTMKTTARLLAVAVFILALAPAAQAAKDWTAVASTGTIDNTSLGFFAFNGPSLTYLSGSSSLQPIIARYNVTNTFDNNSNPDQPGWTTLELGYDNPGAAGAITATLFQVDPCTGAQTTLCVVSSQAATTNSCSPPCTFSTVIDFSRHLYYIQVRLARTATTLFPVAKTLRLF